MRDSYLPKAPREPSLNIFDQKHQYSRPPSIFLFDFHIDVNPGVNLIQGEYMVLSKAYGIN